MNHYIGDLHLFNRNQTGEGRNYDNRPFDTVADMNQYVLQHWNAKITNGDTVRCLGDMAMRGNNDELLAMVAQLKGRKIFLRGNHDDLSDYRYKQLFADIMDYDEIRDSVDGRVYNLCIMHYPVMFWNGQHRGTILLYAHTHQTYEDFFFQNCIWRLNRHEKESERGGKYIRAFNVGAMMPFMGYEPQTLKVIMAAYDAYERALAELTGEDPNPAFCQSETKFVNEMRQYAKNVLALANGTSTMQSLTI